MEKKKKNPTWTNKQRNRNAIGSLRGKISFVRSEIIERLFYWFLIMAMLSNLQLSYSSRTHMWSDVDDVHQDSDRFSSYSDHGKSPYRGKKSLVIMKRVESNCKKKMTATIFWKALFIPWGRKKRRVPVQRKLPKKQSFSCGRSRRRLSRK